MVEPSHVGHAPAGPSSARLRLLAAMLLLPLVAATLAGLALLWPHGAGTHLPPGLGPPARTYPAVVIEALYRPCERDMSVPDDAAARLLCVRSQVRLHGGPDRGSLVVLESSGSARSALPRAGDKVRLAYAPDAEAGSQYYLVDRQRTLPMALLAGLFLAAVLVLGRWRGLLSLVGLGVTLFLLVRFALPALLAGSSPVLVAVVAASASMFVVLYLAHGVSVRTSVAVVGTLASLAVTGALGSVFVPATALTGLGTDETSFLAEIVGTVDLRGLLLAGIIIGALGVLDDVTVTQASAVWELHGADPSLRYRALYGAAMRIGRDHVAAAVNTLALAYAGAALPLLLLFTLARAPLAEVVTGELIAQEIVRTFVGGIGLVAAVPLTTALAAFVATGDRPSGRRHRSRRHSAQVRPLAGLAVEPAIPHSSARNHAGPPP